jgi:hypothetical protein
MDRNIAFLEKRLYFRRNLAKIAENIDHNIDPWSLCRRATGETKKTRTNGCPGTIILSTFPRIRRSRVRVQAHQVFQVEGLLDEVEAVEVVAPELVLLHHFGNQLVPDREQISQFKVCFCTRNTNFVSSTKLVLYDTKFGRTTQIEALLFALCGKNSVAGHKIHASFKQTHNF